jgi:hypothetical protein
MKRRRPSSAALLNRQSIVCRLAWRRPPIGPAVQDAGERGPV